MRLLTKFVRDTSGVTAIEYGLIAAVIGTGLISALTAVGGYSTNIYGKLTETVDPLHEHRYVTYELASNFYDAISATNGSGCNGYGSCGHGINYASSMAYFDFVAQNGYDVTDNLTAMDAIRNEIKQDLTASGFGNFTIGSASNPVSFGDEPTQNLSQHQAAYQASMDYLASCAPGCLP